jgi:site-specific recombinase XerD
MASVGYFSARKNWRIQYSLKLRGQRVQKAKYASSKADANLFRRQLERLEDATATGIAGIKDIEEWVARKWLTQDEAFLAFPGYEETIRRTCTPESAQVDFQAILDRYEDYAVSHSKAQSPDRKTHQNSMYVAQNVIEWLKREHPGLELTSEEIRRKCIDLREEGLAEWTVSRWHQKLRLLLDQAMALSMIPHNPARQVHLPTPKTHKVRRVLSIEEAQQLLSASPNYRKWINGCLPTVVKLGLYAGLRNEEMAWLKWDRIDWEKRILDIRETSCEATRQRWTPKNHEMRRLDVKQECIDHLREEGARQEAEGIKGPFVIPGGGLRKPWFRERPQRSDVIQKAFSRMVEAEKMPPDITVYSLRHTYATSLLRPPPRGAGLDIRTVQQRMGHSDVKVTMEYLHFIEPEEHPTDALPY